jgi:hypothetical protein
MIDIVYADASGALKTVTLLDMARSHDSSATPTDHPVEDGVLISDHVRPELDRLSMQLHVSNSPIRVEATNMSGVQQTATSTKVPSGPAATTIGWSQPFDRVKDVYDELRGIQRSGQLCTIVTPLRRYANMAITGLSAPVDGTDGIVFTMEAREIRVVQTQTARAPAPRSVRGQPTANAGGQGAGPFANQGPPRSVADRALFR